jgi:hypothetical protein
LMLPTMRSMPRQGRLSDILGRIRSLASHQLVQFEFAVGRKKAGAASRAAPQDVFLEQDDLVSLADKLGGRADATEAAAHDENVALDVLIERRAILELLDEKRREPPILVDHQIAQPALVGTRVRGSHASAALIFGALWCLTDALASVSEGAA